jgi:hypothetical protein
LAAPAPSPAKAAAKHKHHKAASKPAKKR